jgi:hypothetical protein
MHPISSLDTLTRSTLLATRTVRATDGIISHIVWENPDGREAGELFVAVEEVTPEHVEPVRHRIALLLAMPR